MFLFLWLFTIEALKTICGNRLWQFFSIIINSLRKEEINDTLLIDETFSFEEKKKNKAISCKPPPTLEDPDLILGSTVKNFKNGVLLSNRPHGIRSGII